MKNNKLTIFLRNSNIQGMAQPDSGYEVETKDGKKKRILTDNKKVLEVAQNAGGGQKANMRLNADNMWTWTMPLLEGDDVEAIKEWAKEHPQLGKWDDNGNSRFVYRFEDEVIVDTYSSDEEKVEVFQKFLTLSDDQKMAVAVHFGLSPFDKDVKELQNELVSLTGGIISGIPDARKEFLENMDRMMDETALNFRSAVLADIITSTADEVYLLHGETLGASKEAAISMLRQRDELFAVVKRELIGKGKYLQTHANKTESKALEKKEAAKASVDGDLEALDIPKKKAVSK